MGSLSAAQADVPQRCQGKRNWAIKIELIEINMDHSVKYYFL